MKNPFYILFILIFATFQCIELHAQKHLSLTVTLINDSSDYFKVQLKDVNNFTKSWEQKNGQSITHLATAGEYTLSISNKKSGNKTYTFFLRKDTIITIDCNIKILTLENVTITQTKVNTPAGIERISIGEIKRIPSILGEPDALKALQFTPGVQTGGEGATGFFVRGGSMDQNLFLFDGTPLYNVSHLFGLLSVFNPDVVSGAILYKGSFPAKYGGRLSSVVNIESRDGNRNKVTVSGGLGLIASRLTVELPFARDSSGKNGKGSILLSGRRTYADIFTRLINESQSNNKNFTPIPDYYFYDLNAKLSYFLKPGQKIYLSFYNGSDLLNYTESNGLNYITNWKNTAITVGTQLLINSRFSLNTNIFYTGFKYNIINKTDVYNLTLNSQINDFGTRADFKYILNKKRNDFIDFGLFALNQQFNPQNIYANANSIQLDYEKTTTLKALQAAIYAEYYWNPVKWFTLITGFRTSAYNFSNTTYINPEPRAALSLQLLTNEKKDLSFKAAYTRMNQYVHLISNNIASFPTDVWYPVTQNIKPQSSDAISGGLHTSFGKNRYHVSVEAYYKFMTNVVEYAEGSDILMEPNFENNLVTGNGNSYGAEFMFKKSEGRFTAMLAYTLSWTKRQFDDKNFGKVYFASNDRRHNLNTTLSYTINERAEINIAWIFASGNPFTAPIGRIESNNIFMEFERVYPIFGEKNANRMPSFHHLDASFTWKFRPKKGQSSLIISIYNVYDRRNAFFIHVYPERDANQRVLEYKARKISLLPIIPSITYNFMF